MVENPVSILLVEDDDGHATLIQRNLRRLGVPGEVTRVRDGQEALDYLAGRTRSEGPGHGLSLVLVLDINMPRVDGVEVLRSVKSDPSTAAIPVIMLTTADDPADVDRCYRLGCAAYVTKPIPYEDFAESVKRLGNFLSIVRVPARYAS
jgi:CheY-like chemotaxis protein